MRSHILAFVAAVALLLPGPAPAGTVTTREQSQATVEATGITGVTVENPRGLIQVRPSADGRIHIEALKLSTASESWRAQEWARDTRVETSTEGGRYVIRVRYPQRQAIRVNLWRFFQGDFDFPGVEVRLALEVPPRMPVQLQSASGNIESHDLSGLQRLSSVSGDVEVRAAGAPVDVSSTSGDITGAGLGRARVRTVSGDIGLDGVRGPLEARSTSGTVEASGIADSVVASTVSGDIRLDAAPRGLDAGSTSGSILVEGEAGGSVRARSTSGEVRFGLARDVRRVDVSTVSGDIHVRLAAGLGCALKLTSSSGNIETALPLKIRTLTRHEVSGAVRGGGPPVVLHSGSGDIAVTGGGE